jgi:signal transduction histidine kinase
MKVESFIKTDFISASAFAGIADLKKQLLQHSAIVIMEDDQYFGVLTAMDILRKPHIIAIDCICNKTEIETDTSISDALFLMKRDFTDILPVIEKKKFIGLVFKSDILEYLNEHYQELQNEVEQQTKNLEEQNSEFKIKIQQQKQELEKITEQRTKELIDLVETKEKFIRIIIHELRNSFNGILGFLGLLQKNLHQYDSVKIEKFLTHAYQSSSITFDLLVNLSEWLNAKNNKIPFTPEMICLFKLLNDEILTTSLLVEQKEIKLNNCIPENSCVYADKNMVKTIFRNLITNSVKFTDIKGEISIYANEKDHFIETTIKDNGIGLTPEVIKKLFDVKGITSFVGTANETGTGLGLLLCKEFVEIEGGKIWVESILGQGSEFKFTLPKNKQNIDPKKKKHI